MKYCHIFHRDYPWDIRVEKICKALLRNGVEVHLISSNTKKEPKEEVIDGIRIHRLPYLKQKKINDIISIPAFFNLYWIYHIYQLTSIYRFDVFIVRDLPLVLPTWIVGKTFNIPVVYDMAENYPAMWQIFRSKLKVPFLAEILESIAIKIVDHIFVVVEESRDRIVRKGISHQNITIISNTPELDLFKENIEKYKKDIFKDNKINLLYVGYLTKLRGLDTVINALPILIKEIGGIQLNIIGEGIDLSKLKHLAHERGVQEYVHFQGWIDFKYIPYIISRCDIGVIPHYSNDHTDTTIPNKIFDFMACGKPIIVSDAKPLKRVVEKTGCGVIFRAGSSEDFSDKLSKLIKDRGRIQMGEKGKKAVEENYNWNKDSDKLNRICNMLNCSKNDQRQKRLLKN